MKAVLSEDFLRLGYAGLLGPSYALPCASISQAKYAALFGYEEFVYFFRMRESVKGAPVIRQSPARMRQTSVILLASSLGLMLF